MRRQGMILRAVKLRRNDSVRAVIRGSQFLKCGLDQQILLVPHGRGMASTRGPSCALFEPALHPLLVRFMLCKIDLTTRGVGQDSVAARACSGDVRPSDRRPAGPLDRSVFPLANCTNMTRVGCYVGIASRFMLAVAFTVLLPASALAHGRLKGSAPSAGSQLLEVRRELRLDFTEAPDLTFSSVRLTGPDRREITLGAVGYAADSRRSLVVPIAGALKAGRYTIIWQIAGDDGHPVRGRHVRARGFADVHGHGYVSSAVRNHVQLPACSSFVPSPMPVPSALAVIACFALSPGESAARMHHQERLSQGAATQAVPTAQTSAPRRTRAKDVDQEFLRALADHLEDERAIIHAILSTPGSHASHGQLEWARDPANWDETLDKQQREAVALLKHDYREELSPRARAAGGGPPNSASESDEQTRMRSLSAALRQGVAIANRFLPRLRRASARDLARRVRATHSDIIKNLGASAGH